MLCLSLQATNPCSASQFWVVRADGNTSCVDCESCPPGQGLSHECGRKISSNAMVTCVPCQAGISFSSSEYDTSSCNHCSAPCSEDQMVLQNCTPTMNVKCDKQCYSKDRYSIVLYKVKGVHVMAEFFFGGFSRKYMYM